MAMFTDDSVLMPAQGSMPAVGRESDPKILVASGRSQGDYHEAEYHLRRNRRRMWYGVRPRTRRGRSEHRGKWNEKKPRQFGDVPQRYEEASGRFLAHFASHVGRRSEQEPIGTTGIGSL